MKCGEVVLRPFDELVIQACVDASDVQHLRIVAKLVRPVIRGYSVKSIRTEAAETASKLKPVAKVSIGTNKSAAASSKGKPQKKKSAPEQQQSKPKKAKKSK